MRNTVFWLLRDFQMTNCPSGLFLSISHLFWSVVEDILNWIVPNKPTDMDIPTDEFAKINQMLPAQEEGPDTSRQSNRDRWLSRLVQKAETTLYNHRKMTTYLVSRRLAPSLSPREAPMIDKKNVEEIVNMAFEFKKIAPTPSEEEEPIPVRSCQGYWGLSRLA